jgi:hypothetical protein
MKSVTPLRSCRPKGQVHQWRLEIPKYSSKCKNMQKYEKMGLGTSLWVWNKVFQEQAWSAARF